MDDNRIVVARFMLDEKNCVTTPIYQYNYGNVLRIEGLTLPSTFEVHFSNDQFGEATTAIGTDNEVTIPDTYLTDPGDVYVWIYLHDTADDGETVYQIMIPLIARAEISNEPPTPEQQDAISQAIAALNEAVSDCEAAVEHYPKIEINGNWYVWDAESGDWVDTGVHAQGEQGDPGISSSIWYSDTEPTDILGHYVFDSRYLHGQTSEPKVNEIIFYETDYYIIDRHVGGNLYECTVKINLKGDQGTSPHVWYTQVAPTPLGNYFVFPFSDLESDTTDKPRAYEPIFYDSAYYIIDYIRYGNEAVCKDKINLKGDTGADGNALWTSSLAPYTIGGADVYIFPKSYLSGDTSRNTQKGDIIYYESKYYRITATYTDDVFTAFIYDFKGATGADGQDGYSPTASVSKSGSTATISITDKNGTTTATVSDGDPTVLIDDTSTASNKVWSADKLNGLLIADISNVTFGGAS